MLSLFKTKKQKTAEIEAQEKLVLEHLDRQWKKYQRHLEEQARIEKELSR